jgi:hypothetical protein
MTSPNFTVGVHNGTAQVYVNEYVDQVNVEEMLSFDHEQIEHLLRTHAGYQAYWEALALRLRLRYETFKDVHARKWWAHHNRYARVISSVYGESKPTKEATQDLVIQTFSVDTNQVTRDRFAHQAWSYEVKKSMSVGTQEEYSAQMYKYLNSTQPWYFENVVENLKQLQEQYDSVRVIADRLNSKSYDLQLYAKLQMAKRGNVGQ